MERLTYREEAEELSKEDLEYDGNSQRYVKLAEFENFMEEQGVQSLKELKEKVDFKKRIDIAPIEKAFREKQKIQDKWQELKFFVETEYKENSQMVDICKRYEKKEKDMFLHYLECYGTLLDKIEELEKE